MIVGGYTLDLYCANPNCRHGKYGTIPTQATYFAEQGSACRRVARKDGWKFIPGDSRNGQDVLCPGCARDANAKAPVRTEALAQAPLGGGRPS